MRERLWQSALFSLTPALSRWERGKPEAALAAVERAGYARLAD